MSKWSKTTFFSLEPIDDLQYSLLSLWWAAEMFQYPTSNEWKGLAKYTASQKNNVHVLSQVPSSLLRGPGGHAISQPKDPLGDGV